MAPPLFFFRWNACLPTQHDGSGIAEVGVGAGVGGGGGAYKDSLSSLPQAAFNYINSIVGSGVIGIPYAFHKAGFGFGLLLLAFVAVITDYSLILMVSRRGEEWGLKRTPQMGLWIKLNAPPINRSVVVT